MSWNRREILGGLGIASAQTLLWAMGCTGQTRPVRRAPDTSGEIRTWLRDAVSMLHGAGFTTAHALAVSRRRSTAARDVLGAGVAHARCDGVVLTVQDARGFREQVTSDLSRDGVMAAVVAIAGRSVAPAWIDFGAPPSPAAVPKPDPDTISDASLLARVDAMAARDKGLSSRIVYAAAMIDIDDATVWSVARGRDLEQRLYRVRRSLTRVAWNGTRPVVSEVARAWSGGLDDQTLGDDQIEYAHAAALAMMTPGAFADGEHRIMLAPTVVANVIDAAVQALLTTTALRRPEVAKRLVIGATVASPVLTLVDDPTSHAAYGGFEFDDEGEPAAPVTLLDRGRVVGRLSDRAGVAAGVSTGAGRGRRAGHVGRVEPAASHVRLEAGTGELVLDEGFLLEGGLGAIVDPSSDRVVIAVQRALEIRGGKRTGRVYADVELVGDLASLLASIVETSRQTATIGIRDELDGQPRWRSIETPWLRGTGVVRARRRPT